MLAYVKLADKVGYPKLLQLWYYHPDAVELYAIASEDERRRMFEKGGGHLPLQGQLERSQVSWRIYPFAQLLQTFEDLRPPEHIKTILGAHDERINESIRRMHRGPDIAGNQYYLKGEPLWRDFRAHYSVSCD